MLREQSKIREACRRETTSSVVAPHNQREEKRSDLSWTHLGLGHNHVLECSAFGFWDFRACANPAFARFHRGVLSSLRFSLQLQKLSRRNISFEYWGKDSIHTHIENERHVYRDGSVYKLPIGLEDENDGRRTIL